MDLPGSGFPGRDLLFMFVLFTFIVPPQTIIVPLFILYRELGWIDTFLPFTVPAFFSHGLRGSLLVLIFRQFFKRQPYELEEAAAIDGCSPLRTFAQIMLPLARPALLVVFLFSLVWHWNDYYEPMMYLMKPQNFTVPLRLSILQQGIARAHRRSGGRVVQRAPDDGSVLPGGAAAALLVHADAKVLRGIDREDRSGRLIAGRMVKGRGSVRRASSRDFS